MVINFVLTEILLNVLRIGVHHHQLHASNLREILHVLLSHNSCSPYDERRPRNPRRAACLEIGPALPHGTCDRQLRQWLQGFHRIHFVYDEESDCQDQSSRR